MNGGPYPFLWGECTAPSASTTGRLVALASCRAAVLHPHPPQKGSEGSTGPTKSPWIHWGWWASKQPPKRRAIGKINALNSYKASVLKKPLTSVLERRSINPRSCRVAVLSTTPPPYQAHCQHLCRGDWWPLQSCGAGHRHDATAVFDIIDINIGVGGGGGFTGRYISFALL